MVLPFDILFKSFREEIYVLNVNEVYYFVVWINFTINPNFLFKWLHKCFVCIGSELVFLIMK